MFFLFFVSFCFCSHTNTSRVLSSFLRHRPPASANPICVSRSGEQGHFFLPQNSYSPVASRLCILLLLANDAWMFWSQKEGFETKPTRGEISICPVLELMSTLLVVFWELNRKGKALCDVRYEWTVLRDPVVFLAKRDPYPEFVCGCFADRFNRLLFVPKCC